MPSLEHAALVEMFRTHPELIPLLLREALGVTVPAYQSLAVTEAALDQLVPIEFRADLVVEFLAENNKRPVLSSIVEVQLRIDEAKYFSWPVYVTVERSRKRCETCLIVVAPDPAVAAWARGPIRIGPGNELRPIVLGPAQIPIVTDREAGLANPILAVLSALAHRNDPEHGPPTVRIALEALATLDSEDSKIYAHVIFEALPEVVARALRNEAMLRDQFPDTELKGQFLLKIVDQYRALHAEEARVKALTADEASIRARTEADQARLKVDEARIKAAEARLMADEARIKADEARINVAEARVKADEARINVAEARVKADEVRIKAAEARVKADEARINARGEIAMLLKIIDHRGLALTDEQRHTIETCEDRAQLDHWAERALDVKTAADLFA